MSECDNCEYRACRQEDAELGPCQEPILNKNIIKLKRDLKVSVGIIVIITGIMLYVTGWAG